MTASASALDAPRDDREFLFRFPRGGYAFAVDVRVEDGGSDGTRTGDGVHRYASRFGVRGGDLRLEPSDAVNEVYHRSYTLIVRTQATRDSRDSRDDRLALIADRLDTDTIPDRAASLSRFELYNPAYELVREPDRPAPTVGRLVTELLRDGFAHYEGYRNLLTRLRIETATPEDPLSGSGGAGTVVYEGTPWRLESESGGTD